MAVEAGVGSGEQGVSPGSRARPTAAANGWEELAGQESGGGAGKGLGLGERVGSCHQKLGDCSKGSCHLAWPLGLELKGLGEAGGGELGRSEGLGRKGRWAARVGGL